MSDENATLLAQLSNYQQVKAQLVSFQTDAPKTVDTKGLELSLQFKTGSDSIENVYENQLDALAKLLDADKGLAVHLAAYADARGDAEFNQSLSAKRLASVESALRHRGVKSNQISGKAFGAVNGIDPSTSHEALFFDRKVTITLRPAFTDVASN